MSKTRAILPLLAVPVIVGLIAGIAGYGQEFIKLLVTLLKIGEWVLGGLIAYKIVRFFVPGAPEQPSAPTLLYPQRDTPLERGFIEQDSRSGGYLHADGYVFEVRNIGGVLKWREVDPSTKSPLQKWVQKHERDLRDDKRVLVESITIKVNERKGL